MIKRIVAALLIICIAVSAGAQQKPVSGMKITKSTKIIKADYKLDAPSDNENALITVEGTNITIDFANAELKGSNNAKTPDEFFGTAILITNSKNVTIKNLKAKGYKIALLARNVEKLTLENCDFSYNYRPHLNSTQEKEDISDWMSYHHNEKDEWLRYGAAMYLRGCNNAIISNCKVTGGQNGLMMMECNDGKIFNNDFSFNSGIGLGMYRSSNNNIMFNRIIFNVRGYSHGVYNRGQDSAGILMYEQSNNNHIYMNAVTHGGDGFFLWAGQTTMDNGKGGCNNNGIFSNDFSYAPTNGVEVTFSSNRIEDNRIYECDNGIWAGYSYDTRISDNKFRNNNTDIAIEHGQNNLITYNLFYKSKKAIHLWARKEQPADWGYAKFRDTRSRNYLIANNTFNQCGVVFDLTLSDSLHIFHNTYGDNERLYKRDSTVTNLDLEGSAELENQVSVDITRYRPIVSKPNDPFKGSGKYAGRKNIMITEWGPYDFRSPIIWNTNPVDTSDIMKFNIIGPKGKWKIKSAKGVDGISKNNGSFPDSITVHKIRGDRTDIAIELEYTGEAMTTPFGRPIAANKPYIFSFTKFFQPVNWDVLWFSLDTAFYNPIRTNQLFSPTVRMAPFKSEKTTRLDYAWWGGIKAGNDQHLQFITIAEGNADIPKGTYELGVTWDDAVRVYVDGKLVIDEWNPSKYTFDESPNKKIRLDLGGTHNFRVEHIELGGFATLSWKLTPVRN